MTFEKRTRQGSPAAGQSGDEWLRAAQDRLASTFELAGVGILEIDPTGEILRVNRRACDLMGYAADDLVGRSIFNETSPLDVAQDLQQFRRQVAGEIDRYTIEKRLMRKDGSCVWAEVTSSSVRDASGNFLYAVRVQYDITERRQAEARQRHLIDELGHRAGNDMQVLQSLFLMSARAARSDDARAALRKASARIAVIAAVQRVLRGRSASEGFEAEKLLSAVCQTIRQRSPAESPVECRSEGGTLPSRIAMPLALMANELVTNAIEHGDAGQASGQVRVTLTNRNGQMTLCVEDDGKGFDLEEVRGRSSGLLFVTALAHQLGGAFTVARDPSRTCVAFRPAAIATDG